MRSPRARGSTRSRRCCEGAAPSPACAGIYRPLQFSSGVNDSLPRARGSTLLLLPPPHRGVSPRAGIYPLPPAPHRSAAVSPRARGSTLPACAGILPAQTRNNASRSVSPACAGIYPGGRSPLDEGESPPACGDLPFGIIPRHRPEGVSPARGDLPFHPSYLSP